MSPALCAVEEGHQLERVPTRTDRSAVAAIAPLDNVTTPIRAGIARRTSNASAMRPQGRPQQHASHDSGTNVLPLTRQLGSRGRNQADPWTDALDGR